MSSRTATTRWCSAVIRRSVRTPIPSSSPSRSRQAAFVAGMNVNVWDVQDQIRALVRAGYAGNTVDLSHLADPHIPLSDLTN